MEHDSTLANAIARSRTHDEIVQVNATEVAVEALEQLAEAQGLEFGSCPTTDAYGRAMVECWAYDPQASDAARDDAAWRVEVNRG